MMIINLAIMVKTEWPMAVACSDLLGGMSEKSPFDCVNRETGTQTPSDAVCQRKQSKKKSAAVVMHNLIHDRHGHT